MRTYWARTQTLTRCYGVAELCGPVNRISPVRISDTYRELNLGLHRTNPDYGRAAHALAPWVVEFAQASGAQTLLDYGCGKGTLRPAVLALDPNLVVAEYDPAVPGKDREPEPSELVVCIDVLEHVEPPCLADVLTHIKSLSLGGALFIVDTVPAQKTLADGRNAHLIVEGLDWWTTTLSDYFDVKVSQPLAPDQPPRVLIIGVRKP